MTPKESAPMPTSAQSIGANIVAISSEHKKLNASIVQVQNAVRRSTLVLSNASTRQGINAAPLTCVAASTVKIPHKTNQTAKKSAVLIPCCNSPFGGNWGVCRHMITENSKTMQPTQYSLTPPPHPDPASAPAPMQTASASLSWLGLRLIPGPSPQRVLVALPDCALKGLVVHIAFAVAGSPFPIVKNTRDTARERRLDKTQEKEYCEDIERI